MLRRPVMWLRSTALTPRKVGTDRTRQVPPARGTEAGCGCQQGGLSGAVRSDHADGFADVYVEGDAADGVDGLGCRLLAAQHVAYEGPVRADRVADLDVGAPDGQVGVAHPVPP